MVFLHEVERQAAEVRPTDDVDIAVNVRAEVAGLARIHFVLTAARFSQDPVSSDGVAHRYRRGSAVLNIVASDEVGERAQLRLGAGRTIRAPGTAQAFRRSEIAHVDVGGRSARIRRPTLVGALIATASTVQASSSEPPANRSKLISDFDSLARLLGPSDRATADLGEGETKMLAELAREVDMSPLGRAAVEALTAADS